MRFFRTLLTDDQPFTTEPANESIRIETIDLVGPAALSSPLVSHAQVMATDGSLAFDAKALDTGAVAHTAAPAWLTGVELNHAVHGVPAPVDQIAGVEAVSVPDASTAAAVETAVTMSAVAASADAVSPSGAGTSHEVPAAHAVDATTVTPSAGTDGVVPSSVVPAVGAFVVLGDGHATPQTAVPHAVLVPWEISAEGATTTIGATAPSATETAAASEAASIPRPADGADRWENHSMFSVNPPSDGKAAETTAEGVAGVTAVTTVTSDSSHPPEAVNEADADALRNFLDNWLCILPVQPESLRDAHLPEFTLPLRTSEALIVPQVITAEVFDSTTHQTLTAEVFDSTTHQAITAASMPLVIAEQHAVL